ncbi:DUF1232 domain-containing protein [Oscillatoria amoena NRMC-F 0135]|nr:DUF1232 domain-containing protein [Oscillatoria amoena NRMC-F 0135]
MNPLFEKTLAQASLLRNKYSRIAILLAKVAAKMGNVNWKHETTTGLKEKTAITIRIVKAYITGRYTSIPWRTIVVLLAALIYFLNPIDFIPDILPVIGFGDDFAVLMWVYQSVTTEVDKFLAWEKLQPVTT